MTKHKINKKNCGIGKETDKTAEFTEYKEHIHKEHSRGNK